MQASKFHDFWLKRGDPPKPELSDKDLPAISGHSKDTFPGLSEVSGLAIVSDRKLPVGVMLFCHLGTASHHFVCNSCCKLQLLKTFLGDCERVRGHANLACSTL